MRLDRNKMQTPATLRIIAPGLPESQKVVAKPKPGFKHGKMRTAPPALWQAVTRHKNLTCLGKGDRTGIIYVVIPDADRRSVGIQIKRCRNQGLVTGRHCLLRGSNNKSVTSANRRHVQ